MAYIDELGNHYNDDFTELIQVNNKLKYYSVPSNIRIIREFAFIHSKLEVIIFNGKIDTIKGLWGLNVSQIYVPLGLTEYFANLFNLNAIRNFIKEIDLQKVECYYNIGVSMLEGDGITKDEPEAIEYLEYCAKNFDARAIYKLAQYYENRQLYIKAYNRYLKASYFLYKDASFKTNSLKAMALQEQKDNELKQQMLNDKSKPMILFFDTETTGVPRDYNAPITNSYNWPRLVQLAWILTDESGKQIKHKVAVIRPEGYIIPNDATAVHGITTDYALRNGQSLRVVLEDFIKDLENVRLIVGHNIDFDQHIVGAELYRLGLSYDKLMHKPTICTMKASIDFCKLPPIKYGQYKWPKLQELYCKLFGHDFSNSHDALADITATKDCYYELKRRNII